MNNAIPLRPCRLLGGRPSLWALWWAGYNVCIVGDYHTAARRASSPCSCHLGGRTHRVPAGRWEWHTCILRSRPYSPVRADPHRSPHFYWIPSLLLQPQVTPGGIGAQCTEGQSLVGAAGSSCRTWLPGAVFIDGTDSELLRAAQIELLVPSDRERAVGGGVHGSSSSCGR